MTPMFATRLAIVSLAALLMVSTAAPADERAADTAPAIEASDDAPNDEPREEPRNEPKGDEGGGPLTHPVDETADEPNDLPWDGEVPPANDPTPRTSPTADPIDTDEDMPADDPTPGGGVIPVGETVPTGDMSCAYVPWSVGDDGTLHEAAFLTNTGGTVIHAGSVLHFEFADGTSFDYVLPTDIQPDGNWSVVTGVPNGFPPGVNLPAGDCDLDLILA